MIALACDHAALEMKQMIKNLLNEMGLEYHDYGTFTEDSCDYPIFAARAASAVASGECDRAIVICGTGIGMSIAANKVKGVRCALCGDVYSAEMTRRHNDSNVLALGARVTGIEVARLIAKTWLSTEFEGGRHARRVELISKIEAGENLG